MPRPKDSTIVQLQKGVDKKDPKRINKAEPNSGNLKGMPDFLTKREKFWWRKVVKMTADGVLQNSDYFSMIMLVREMSRYAADPSLMSSSEKSLLRGLFGEFGMTPATRRNLQVTGKDGKKTNPYSDI